MTQKNLLLQNGLLVTMNQSGDVFKGDILIENGHILKIDRTIDPVEASHTPYTIGSSGWRP